MPFNPYTGRYDQNSYPFYPNFTPQQEQVTRVTGIDGARAMQMGPNSSKICIDETRNNRLFLCMTDGAGFKTVRPIRCEFEDIEPEPQEDRFASLEKRIKDLEGVVNDKLNPGNVKKRNVADELK